ncbi:hypothetical protein HIM_00480 [Hirsutella minnesotensis 3608]|nr:hypothetical protein HIM_00480 [Hirsutella minnesotensis 3608]
MLPIQSLLNPASPKVRTNCSRETASAFTPDSSFDNTWTNTPTMDTRTAPKVSPASRALTPAHKFRTQGPVRYPPYENVDDRAMREVARYEISPFGHIEQCSEHIPYNSTKKNFYAKTGRESIEAFKYEFRVPGQNVTYKVMWDYNIGLVRMTPFSSAWVIPRPSHRKCWTRIRACERCPQALQADPWARKCARAVCATFCHDIAGALIPLFGPRFPLECTPPDSQFFGDMVIDQRLVAQAKSEAEVSRSSYVTRRGVALNGSSQQQIAGTNPYGLTQSLRRDVENTWFEPSRHALQPGLTAAHFDCPKVPSTSGQRTTDQIEAETKHPYSDDGRTFHRPSSTIAHIPTASAPQTCISRALAVDSILPMKPWSMKRRQTDRDRLNEAYSPTRSKVARLTYDRPSDQRQTLNISNDRAPTFRDRGEDYAAAAVLIGLQATNTTAAVSSAAGLRTASPQHSSGRFH